jgi:uncharacterized protein YjbI with pentapeptide repeats
MKRALFALPFFAVMAAAPATAQNPTQIASVKAGAKACVACNLFQADFAYLELDGRNFAKARLRQADLTVATANGASFTGADLSIVNAFGARFSGARMNNANLADGTFVGAHFEGANLAGARLERANFSGADLSLAKGLSQIQLNQACGDANTSLPAGMTIPSC